MFPDMLGIRDRIQNVLLVKESTDPSVGWLLLGGRVKQPLGKTLESSIAGSVQSRR